MPLMNRLPQTLLVLSFMTTLLFAADPTPKSGQRLVQA
jgi:hypothetical protein